MTPDEIRANLTAKQRNRYETARLGSLIDEREALEALAERNRLLKKHQYYPVWNPDKTHSKLICHGCKQWIDNGCSPDCAIAAALKGVGE